MKKMMERMRGVIVKVDLTPHPMEENHYIEWTELIEEDGKVHRKFLRPGDKPEARFPVQYSESLKAREYCNVHGLWKKE